MPQINFSLIFCSKFELLATKTYLTPSHNLKLYFQAHIVFYWSILMKKIWGRIGVQPIEGVEKCIFLFHLIFGQKIQIFFLQFLSFPLNRMHKCSHFVPNYLIYLRSTYYRINTDMNYTFQGFYYILSSIIFGNYMNFLCLSTFY